ncbi:LOW QUALITY PROTEIN: Fc receptor-like protein 5 [Cottoperca gobio]|uniref:LOW QUALITY PROTEIN: Fc receptor-like protein 5 n=1 Tax=Cottoperca gobio TaxID=56716 RepID=A0A6J2RPU9_COTGO|nr:LOW QUALITY PROTEIN: Fc receptor-like protein 5 [Cottoperca gobio]
MGHALRCVLALLSLNILYCGHAQDAVLNIEPNWSTFFTGESVTFMCGVTGVKDPNSYYKIYKADQRDDDYTKNENYTLQPLAKDWSGEYHCLMTHLGSTKESNKVSLTVSDKDVIVETPASTLFEGEPVTLRCRHRTPREGQDAVFYRDGSPIEVDTNHQSPMRSTNTVQVTSDRSSYMCKFEDEESEAITLKMEPQPKAQLSQDDHVGGNVTLTCSVKTSSSSGWKYFWYRGKKASEALTTQGVVFHSDAKISVSEGGLYWCRGGTGDPVYYTEYSHSAGKEEIFTNKAVVTRRPNWPEIYRGETVTLTCDIKDGGDTEWEYSWTTSSSSTPPRTHEYMISNAESSHSGDYRCKGTLKGERSTKWSDAIILRVSDNKPRPVLNVSLSWLSPGASVTLTCSVEHPAAGWRYYWYKAVPKLSDNSYSSELLPGSSTGTEQDSYIVHGQTHTAGYVCRAGRGDPVYYTQYSQPKFVWSGDVHSAASLSVSPDRLQHFTDTSVSLSCEGNSTEWSVNRFSEYGNRVTCSVWGTMTGSTCNMNRDWTSGVYWCESETGQFSNAVNISTVLSDGVILVSPVRPVAEGDSVTLGCKLKTEKVLYNVDFYKNGKLIQNNTKGELTISAVSKSDEGFYKCKGLKSKDSQYSWTSPESWMSVTSAASGPVESSPSPVLWIVGLLCGVSFLIMFLLFLYRCRKSNDSCFTSRSQSTNQGPATDHMINQGETQQREYATLLHGDACLYETIQGPEEPEHGENNEPEESEYINVTMESAADQ